MIQADSDMVKAYSRILCMRAWKNILAFSGGKCLIQQKMFGDTHTQNASHPRESSNA